MNILYCSTVCSQNILTQLSNKLGVAMSSLTIQKFHRLILKGLVFNSAKVSTASIIPITGKLNNKRYIKYHEEQEDGIHYNYVTTYNIPLLRHILIAINTIRKMLKWHKENKTTVHIIICDALNISVSIGALLGKAIDIKVIAIMTAVPGLMKGSNQNVIGTIIKILN